MSGEEVRVRLRALAEHHRSAKAPPRVEAALIAAFSERAACPKRRVAPLRWAWAGLAAAAGVIVAIALMPPGRVDLPPLSRPQAPSPPAIAFVRPPEAPTPRLQIREVATPFYALQFGPPDTIERVVRMRVPRTMLALFGLPMNPDRIWEPIQADVAFDDGGLARAIRFVHEVPVYSQVSRRGGADE